jgi:hypothetical protein
MIDKVKTELVGYIHPKIEGLDISTWDRNEYKWATISPQNDEKTTLYIHKGTTKEDVMEMLKSLIENADIVYTDY